MKDRSRTNQELFEEISALKKKINKLERSESALKQAEVALRLSEGKLQATLDATPFPIAVVDLQDDRIIFWSRSALTLFGHTAPTASEWYQLAYPDSDYRREVIGRWKPFLEIASKSDQPVNTGEYRITCKDGSVRICELYATFLPDNLIVTFNDITRQKQAEMVLRENETKLQAIFDIVGTGIMIIDKNTQIINEANQTAINMVGLPRERIIGQICHSLVCPAQAGKCPVKDLGQSVDQSERKLVCADGHLKDILKTVYPITIGGRDCYIESFIDISGRKQVEEALQESEERYRVFVENASDIVFRTDDSGYFTYINPVALIITGYKEEELIGTQYLALINPDMAEETMKFFGRQFVKEIQNTYFEYPIIAKDKHEIWLGQNTQLIVEDGRVQGFQAMARDITDRKRMEAEILALSITDQLTGLHNRRGFLSLAEQQLKLSERNKSGMSLFFADLDLLKWINDTIGHEEGDKALIEAGNILKETFRSSDIIARLGGDEYAVLVVDITEANSKIFTSRLQAVIDKRNNQENRKYKLSISMGCAYYNPENPCSIDDLIARADKLMYEQKQKKKDLLSQSASLSSR
jgi:diguanylate cyclase (GGDEF)-like protein/PAS domain S-box-containing protein